MASMFKSGSSRRKAELPGRLRIQLKSKKSKSSKHDDVDDDDTDNDEADKDEQLTVSFGNGIPDDLPEGTIVVQPEAVEDLPVKRKRDGTTVTLSETVEDVPAKKKRESLTRINIAVLDNVSCTACGHQLNPYKNGALQKHPELKVAICKHCDKFLSSGAISKDEDGTDEQCRWCGEGGRLLVCDDCSSAFCKACVMRNFSRSQFNTINDQDNWQCYLCNPTPLENLRENYRKIRDTLKAIKEKEKLKSAVSTASPAGKGMPSSGRLAVSKDNVTIPTTKNASSVTRSGKQPPVVSDQNVEEEMPASSVLLRLEDLNVKFSNVDTTIDKLCTATNTFREVLLAVKSQSKVLSAQLQLKRQQNLHKSLEAYLRSLKIILTESQNTDEDEQQLTHTKDIPAVKSSNKESSLCTSSSKTSSSSSRSSTNSSTIQKGSISRPHANTNSIDSKKPAHGQQSSPAAKETQNDVSKSKKKIDKDLLEDGSKNKKSVKAVNGDITKEDDSIKSASKSSKDTITDTETDSDSLPSTKKKNSIDNNSRNKKRTDNTTKSSSIKKSSGDHSQNSAEESVSDTDTANNEDDDKRSKKASVISNKDAIEDDDRSKKTSLSSNKDAKEDDVKRSKKASLSSNKDTIEDDDRSKKTSLSSNKDAKEDDVKRSKKASLSSNKDANESSRNKKSEKISLSSEKNADESLHNKDDDKQSEKSSLNSSKDANESSQNETSERVSNTIETDIDSGEEDKRSENTSLSSKKDCGESSQNKDGDSISNTNNTDVNSIDETKDGKSEQRTLRKKKNDPEVEINEEDKTASDHDDEIQQIVAKLTKKRNSSDSNSEKLHNENGDPIQENMDLSESLQADETEKEETAISNNCSTHDDENLAAKFDLIKELADEMLKDDGDSDGENDEEDLPITFGKHIQSESETESKKKNKHKKEQSPSDEMVEVSKKKSESSSSLESKALSKKEKESKKEKTDKKEKADKRKDKQDSADVRASSGDSSSDLLMSGGDDADSTIKVRRKKNKNKRNVAEENLKTTKKGEKTHSKDKKKSEDSKQSTRSQSPEMDDIDKEIEKLSKLPTMRKRKAADMSEDEEAAEDKEEAVSKVAQTTQKRSKPGPKSSKKGVDYDDLSSDDNEKKDDEEEDIEEDEDELPVTFFNDSVGTAGQKDLDEENEIAKNGLLEDMESDKENTEDDDDLTSDEDSDALKKLAKKEPKQSNDIKKESDTECENEDSDENIGKRKKLRSKLLDAKLSDSDSDIVKPKKKKKDEDDESFKSDISSSSSKDSDVSESDDDSSNDSDDSDDDGPKSKKKGNKTNIKKKKKKKGRKSSSDDDDDSSDDRGKKNKKGKGKKRKRIKKMSNSTDDDDDNEDDDDPNNSKAGKRKEIRKVMSNKRLEDSTKAAAKAEEKRRKRIAARQREFNIETITDENNPMNCPMTTKLVLEAGKEEGDDPLVQVNKKLVRKLKPHQVEAVQFLWDCLYESVKRSKKQEGAGCILAHCMGLGKTLSVIAFVHTVLSHQKILKHRTCLVVSPLNTVLNWKNEWTMWLDEKDQMEVWELASCKQNPGRANLLKEWQENGGIMIIGYEMYRNLTLSNRCKNKRQKKIFQETLVDPGPDLVICDEGHILKNEASAISKAMNLMKTRRRVALTGTPLQNNLTEYHCMVSFVKPNLLGTRKEFTNRFISPIQNGQCTDSTQEDVKLMKARAHVLHELLAGCVQRRDYSALTKFLPPKQEYVISVRLTNIQIELYEKYLETTGVGVDGVFNSKGARLFADYQNLMKIWTHPWVLKLAEIRDELKVKYDDEESFIDDENTDEDEMSFSSSSSSKEDRDASDSGGEGTSSKPSKSRGTRRTRANTRRKAGDDSDSDEVISEWKTKRSTNRLDDVLPIEEQDKRVTNDWWAQYVTEDDKGKLELSNKLSLLFEILRMCEEIGDKVLIFSQSILSLNIIESFLEVIDTKFQQETENMSEEEKEKQGEGVFGRSWTKNLDYYRMDGSTNVQNRQAWASNFNDIDNYRTRLFLISTRAGGLGINLVAANRVIIFDASWNPSHDVQSIFRVYRFGQTKPCYIYRFLAQGTMEDKIYERQVTKLSLSQRVVDEHQIERHFSANDLKDMYNFRPDRLDDGKEKPTLALPRDPLLAEILTSNKHCVVTFHEHDSLLENQIEQTLTEEEKKSAWEEFENEKKGIIVRGPGMGNASNWPMMAAAQILSREQIAATVQALRQQLPDITEDLFHLHLQQALKRQVQIKQEDMRRMELLRMQEMNYMNMIKQQSQQAGLSHGMQGGMPTWMQMQMNQLRNMKLNPALLNAKGGAKVGMPVAAPTKRQKPAASTISNKPEEAIDLDDN